MTGGSGVREIPAGSSLWDDLAPAWHGLSERTGDPSAFLSPTWMEEWIASFGGRMRSRALVWLDDVDDPVGCAVLSEGRGKVGPFPVSRRFLNAAGVSGVGCEHNDVLALPGHRQRVIEGLCRALRERGPDQVVLQGVRDSLFQELRAAWPSDAWSGYCSESPYVDLAALRRSGGDYLSALSSNKRSQIRRSVRKYEERFGPVELRIPTSVSEALEAFDEMVALHEQRWRSVGKPGAFGAAARAFHERLIQRVFDEPGRRGALSIDFARIRFGEETVGILYNLVYRGRVQFYQSGLRYHEDPHLKPGLVAHALAAQNALERGDLEYDFLGGEPDPVRYKRSLSTNRRALYWAQLPRDSLKMSIIERLRRLKRGMARISARGRHSLAG